MHRDCPSSIELLEPAEGAVPGERVFVDGFSDSSTATQQLNPKKKIWDKIQVMMDCPLQFHVTVLARLHIVLQVMGCDVN